MAAPATPLTAPAPLPVLDIAAVLVMLAVFALTMGYTYPAIAFNLEARGASPALIGAQGALAGLGILAGSLAVPHLVARYGAWPLAMAALYGTATCVAGFGLTENLVVWFVLRPLLGVLVAILFVVSETWINVLSPDDRRGRIVSLYGATVAGLFAAGPMLVPVLGYSGLSSFGTMALVIVLLGLALLRLRHAPSPVERASMRATLTIVRTIPLLLAAVAAFAYFDGAALALWVTYALSLGQGETSAAATLSALIVGNLFLQLPLGWLADRMSRRRLLTILAAAGCAGAVFVPAVDIASPFGYAYLVVWGAACFGVYTLSLTLVGQHLAGQALIAATACFGIAWGLGALAGSWATGGLMNAFGPVMLPVSLAVVYAGLTVLTLALAPIRASVGALRDR